MKAFLPFAALAVLTGCANSANPSSLPSLTYEEASAFERSLLAREPVAPQKHDNLYTQPVNKKEACKLPSSQDQLNRPNFRAYWDGECKNGYASGLGRDISISDTHHYEEITIHDGRGGSYKSQPVIDYNFVENKVSYKVCSSDEMCKAGIEYEEIFNNPAGGSFTLTRSIAEKDEQGNALAIQYADFDPRKVFYNGRFDKSIMYRFIDYSLVPVVNPNTPTPKFTMEVVDQKINATGFAIGYMVDGSVQYLKFNNGIAEHVIAPNDYREHLWGKYQEALSLTARANTILEPTKRLEREYLFKACNGKSGVKGLDNATYTKICTWRDQFKEPYANASANYQKQLENMRAQAATAELERQIQQLLAQQQQRLQQQQYEYQMASLAQSLDGVAKSTNNSVPPTYQFVPIVQPSLSYGSSPTTYRKVGSTVLGSDGTACQIAGSTVICR